MKSDWDTHSGLECQFRSQWIGGQAVLDFNGVTSSSWFTCNYPDFKPRILHPRNSHGSGETEMVGQLTTPLNCSEDHTSCNSAFHLDGAAVLGAG